MSTVPKQDAPGAPPPPDAAALSTSGERPPLGSPAQAPRARPPGGISPGSVIDGRYRVIRFINQGGNGVVHEVEHIRTGRRLAMKSLVDDASAARLEQEARATAIMKSAHVVRITDMGPPPGSRGTPYLVMELLEGQSLRELLDEAGQLPLDITVNIALQVCECLAEAHDRKVIHRDLKPDNLFLQKSAWPGQYDVVVLDFGVMKVAGEGPIPKGSLTRTGSTVGTPYYMSLEQLRNSSAVDARADVYSLGVVLYECLAGRKPFMADTIGDLVYALCSGPPTPLARLRPDLPSDVCDAVMRALKMNRDERLPSMTELGASLLPHGHPAFSLWLRAAEGSAPISVPFAALQDRAAPAPGQLTLPAPAQIVSPQRPRPLAGAGRAGVAPAPPTPDEGEGTTVTAMNALPESPPEQAPAPDLGRIPAPPRLERQTPTEMYTGAFTGDRDTPTRALPTASSAELDAALARSRAAAAAEQGDGTQTHRFDPPRFGSGTERMLGDDARIALGAPGSPPIPDTMISPVQQPAAPLEPPRYDMSLARATAKPSDIADALKPGWQRSLDGALASVGRFVEGSMMRVRTQPKPVQLAIMGTLALVLVLVVVLIALLVFR